MPTEVYLPYKDIELYLRLYEHDPGLPCILFVHGITAHVGFYADLVPGADFLESLSAAGFNVAGLDLQGHGRSGGSRGLYTMSDIIGNARAAVDHIVDLWGGPVALMGSSLGGILAPYIAHAEPRIQAFVAHNIADLRDELPLRLRRQGALVKALRRSAPLFKLVDRIRISATLLFDYRHVWEDPEKHRLWRSDPLAVWRYPLSSIADLYIERANKPAMEDITTAALVISGEWDWIFPVDYCRRICERLGGPSTFVLMEGAGHELPVEHTERFISIAADWLRRTL